MNNKSAAKKSTGIYGNTVAKASSAKPSYAAAVKGILKNPNDSNMATPAPDGTSQRKAENKANAQLIFSKKKLERLESISKDPEAQKTFGLDQMTPEVLAQNREINIASAIAYDQSSSNLKEASTSSVKFKPTVDVLIFEVSHYNNFVRTPVTPTANYTDYLKKANMVSECLYNIIKNVDEKDGQIDKTIKAEIEKQIALNPSLSLSTSMSAAMEKNTCDAVLSGRNLIILDEVIYKHQDATMDQPAITVTFLDHAIAGALQQYKESPFLIRLIRIILNAIAPIRKKLGIGGRITRRNKKTSKRRKSKRRSRRRNSSRKNFARKN
jgi:hypothetical protein